MAVWISWWQDAELRPAADRGPCGPQWPMVEQPSQDEEEVLLWSEELWIKITVCLRLQLISHTQPALTLSRRKCERCIYMQNCFRSFIEVRHYVWLCSAYICICICMRLYNTALVMKGSACGVMVIVAGYGHGDTSSNPGPDWLHFT